MGKGRQVVYCDGCGRILKEEEFDHGRAHTIDNRNYCVECRPAAASPESAPVPVETPRAFKQVSSTRLPGLGSSSFRIARASTTEAPRVTAEAARQGSSTKVVLLGVGLVAVGVLLVAVFASGGGGSGTRVEPRSTDVVVAPPPPPPPPQTLDRGLSAPTSRFEPGKAELDLALAQKKAQPSDLGGLMRAFQKVSEIGGDNPFGEQARREIAQVNQELQKQLSAVEEQGRVLFTAEKFKATQDLWTGVRRRHDLREWTDAVAAKIEDIQRTAAGRYAQVREKAVEARKRNDAPEIKANRDRVAKWGLEEYAKDLESALAETAPDAPATPPPPAPPKGAEALAARWREAMKLAMDRDYAGAQKCLGEFVPPPGDKETKAESAGDLENLKLVAPVAAEGYQALSKLAKGQKVKLAFLDPSGRPAVVEGTLLAEDPGRLEIKAGEASVTVPLGEVMASTLAELFKARSKKAESDGKAAALLCLMEGDPESAKRLLGEPAASIGAKYFEWAASVRGAAVEDPRASEARGSYYAAEHLYPDPSKTGEAVLQYRLLLKDFSQTGFVRRNRGAIAARAEGGKDLLFSASELGSRGSFKLMRLTNKPEALISQKDVEPEKVKDNYVQVDFVALPDVEYRGWAYVGGCCQEVLTFTAQGTELSGPNPKKPQETLSYEPGGAASLPVKLPGMSLKRRHQDHVGPKEPDKWEWVALPLPKYSSPGPKTLRLLSDQKGFSVAYAAVSSVRTAPPREFEMRDLEKTRAEMPGYAESRGSGSLATGKILWEAWEGVQGSKVSDLLSCSNFPDKPTKADFLTKFDAPVDWGDNYGTRIRGYIHPPATGQYIFWMASDDEGELWLSTDERPEAKVKIAFCTTFTGHLEWEKFPTQKSAPIPLRAGRRYYIEALHKEGNGGDHIEAGWQLPDGTQELPIPGNRLSPWKK
jgi:hypothetical protein